MHGSACSYCNMLQDRNIADGSPQDSLYINRAEEEGSWHEASPSSSPTGTEQDTIPCREGQPGSTVPAPMKGAEPVQRHAAARCARSSIINLG